MVLGSLMGSAWAAYSYNQGRFQFDAGQQQTSAHQVMNIRIQQWGLFREDIRDLFNLTTSHMSTYMVVGTLFLGFSVSFIWNCPRFPGDPPWLKLFWVNTFIAAMCYGFLAVWLAMHGAIAAQSASVQLLTRAIRPPYPSASELQRAQYELSQYEAAPNQFFRPPNLLGSKDAVQSQGASRTSGLELPSLPASMPQASQASRTSTESPAIPAALPAGVAQQQERQGQENTNPWETAPGLSAELGMHVKLFQQLQKTFLPFDAYARVCLIACAGNLLPALAYFWIAHQNWNDSGALFVTFMGSCMLMFTTLVLYKLDFYVVKQRMRIYKAVVVCAPLVSCAAVRRWVHDGHAAEGLLQWALVCATCLLHLSWQLLFIWEARPSKEDLDLPMSFRSVRYLDIFGGLRRRQAEERRRLQQALRQRRMGPEVESDDSASYEPSDPGHLQAEQVLGMIGRLLMLNQSCGQSQELLLPEEVQALQRAMDRLVELGCPSWDPDEMDMEVWLQREAISDTGQPLKYYVNLDTFDTAWTPSAVHLDVETLLAEVDRLTGVLRTGQSGRSGVQRFEVEAPPSNFGVGTMSAAQRPFLPTLRRPGSSHEQSSMPWKYFMQISLSVIMAWLITMVYCVFHPAFTANHLVQVKSWPHDFFSPVTMTCAGERVLLGDRYGLYDSQIAQLTGESGTFQPLQIADDAGHMLWAPFASIAAVNSEPIQLLVLQHDGHTVWDLRQNHSRIWKVERMLEPLRTIAVIRDGLAEQECSSSNRERREQTWGILASSTAGESLVLCPQNGTLYPRRQIARFDVDGRPVEALGMHLTPTALWIVAKSTEDDSSWLVRQSRCGARDVYQLPKSRSWATGLCANDANTGSSENPGTLLLAGFSLRHRRPEVWQVRPAEPSKPSGLRFILPQLFPG